VGFEPTSKRGNHTLSTCLFQTLIFVLRQDLDHQPEPYLLKFHHPCGAKNDYFRFACAALPIRFGTTSMERRLVLLPCKRIKPVIYCTSIRQREHTHCCQLIFGGSGGNRTLVRTRKPYAFYMLIPAFIFVMQQDPDHQLHPYPLKLHPIIEA